jgi:hypothetical protein
MAVYTITGLENHPVGTSGLNGIINANWGRLEAMFAPLGAAVPGQFVGWNPSTKVFTLGTISAIGGGANDAFGTVTNADGGKDLTLWNEDQGIMQRIRIEGAAGSERIKII